MKIARFTKALTIALHPEVYEQIKQITDAEQTSMAEWVRAVVETALIDLNKENKLKE
jgi:predicted DNA-binding protein